MGYWSYGVSIRIMVYMNCPNGDGRMLKHTRTDDAGYHITYYACRSCGAIWVEPFSANQLRARDIVKKRKTKRPDGHPTIPSCPVCTQHLTHARGDNIPPAIAAWRCPDGHGYYFDEDEFVTFKKAQTVKLQYHKMWQVPLGSPAQILLTSLILLVLAGGMIAGFRATQQQQTTRSYARGEIAKQQAIINPYVGSATLAVTTTTEKQVFLRIKGISDTDINLTTTDNLVHVVTLHDVKPGQYPYTYILKSDDEVTESETYVLRMPDPAERGR